jgi:hypothetical protein
MLFIFSILLLAFPSAEAAQFRLIRGATLSSPAAGACAAAWGNTAIFVGGLGGGHRQSLDVFVNGTRQATLTTTADHNSCEAAAAAYPGVIAIADGSNLEFFDATTHTLFPYNSSVRLPRSATELGAVGSVTSPVLAFAHSNGGVQVVDSQQRAVVGPSIDLARRDASAVSIRDSTNKEYFAFVAGTRISDSAPVSTVSVLPVDSPTAFVSSQLVHARSVSTCAVTSTNTMVCFGGRDINGNTVKPAEVCTVDTSGVFSCVTRTFSTSASVFVTTWRGRGLASLGPFVASMPNDAVSYEAFSVLDPALTDELVLGDIMFNMWISYATTSAGRFAYSGGGAIGVGVSTANVTVIECLEPCDLPLVVGGSTSGNAATSTGSVVTTSTLSGTAAGSAATGSATRVFLSLQSVLFAIGLFL